MNAKAENPTAKKNPVIRISTEAPSAAVRVQVPTPSDAPSALAQAVDKGFDWLDGRCRNGVVAIGWFIFLAAGAIAWIVSSDNTKDLYRCIDEMRGEHIKFRSDTSIELSNLRSELESATSSSRRLPRASRTGAAALVKAGE